MSSTESMEFTAISRDKQTYCPDCGYELTGLPARSRCPECGYVAKQRLHGHLIDRVYARTVAIGLAILLYVVFDGIVTCLISPIGSGQLGGTLATMNFPGPKLWATTLMQRPIGHYPELPGVIGARTSILCLLAIWMITIKHPHRFLSDRLRLATRWYSVIATGGMIGFTLGLSGYWPDEATGERAACILLVELPATAMLYLYLRALANLVPGEQRRSTLSTLSWLVPSVIAGGAIMMIITFVHNYGRARNYFYTDRSAHIIGFLYGSIAITAGMAAFLAVGSLTLALMSVGFHRSARVLSGGRRVLAWAWRQMFGASADRVRQIGVAAGLVLLVINALLGAERIGWFASRIGVGGNLPLANFVGPKLWLGASALVIDSRYNHGALMSSTMLLVMNLLCVWLLTLRLPEMNRRIAWLTRWFCIAAAGGAMSIAAIKDGSSRWDYESYHWSSTMLATIMLLGEWPTMVLIYALLAKLSRTFHRPEISRQLYLAIGVITLLMASALALPAITHVTGKVPRYSTFVLIICAVHGMLSLAAAFWTSSLVLKLAWSVYRQPRTLGSSRTHVVYREVPPISGSEIQAYVDRKLSAPADQTMADAVR